MTDQNLYCWLGADLWLGSVGGQRRQGGEDFVRAAQVGAGSDVEIESRAGSIPQRQPRPVRAHDLQRSIGLRRGVDGAVVRVFDEDPHRGLRRIDQLNPCEDGHPLTVNLALPAAGINCSSRIIPIAIPGHAVSVGGPRCRRRRGGQRYGEFTCAARNFLHRLIIQDRANPSCFIAAGYSDTHCLAREIRGFIRYTRDVYIVLVSVRMRAVGMASVAGRRSVAGLAVIGEIAAARICRRRSAHPGHERNCTDKNKCCK